MIMLGRHRERIIKRLNRHFNWLIAHSGGDFFKDTMTPPAHAFGGPDGFGCNRLYCFVFTGDTAIQFQPGYGANRPWRTLD